MPVGERAKRAVPPVNGSWGSIESLPDGVLEHILGFLPSQQAVQTSVIARRWRHLWKSATGLRVGSSHATGRLKSLEDLQSLVNHLLLLRRQGSPLDTCELSFYSFICQDDRPHVNLWFRHAVMCKARVLSLSVCGDCLDDPYLELDNLPLVSRHLTRLELNGVRMHSSLLNFSSCPALEYLQIDSCQMSSVKNIVSESLKHLSIYDSVCSYDSRICIYTPKLVSLHLDYLHQITPMLEWMPSLVEAFVRIEEECTDFCNCANYETCDCESCDSSNSMADGSSNSVLLKGVSEAKNLTLISIFEMFIFRRDLRWCPMFRKLKTLTLNEYWCVPDDFRALACILEHSPILENVTLQLFTEAPKLEVEMTLRVSVTKRSAAISEHLKKIELKCKVDDDIVFKVLKFLSAFNIYLMRQKVLFRF